MDKVRWRVDTNGMTNEQLKAAVKAMADSVNAEAAKHQQEIAQYIAQYRDMAKSLEQCRSTIKHLQAKLSEYDGQRRSQRFEYTRRTGRVQQ